MQEALIKMIVIMRTNNFMGILDICTIDEVYMKIFEGRINLEIIACHFDLNSSMWMSKSNA